MDLDMLQFNEKQLAILAGPYRCIIKLFTDHYCETLRKVMWVNTPPFAYFIYKLVKPFVPEKTRHKVVFLGKKYKKWVKLELMFNVSYPHSFSNKNIYTNVQKVPYFRQ